MAEMKPLKISTDGTVARFQTSEVIPVEHGGTGATTAANALSNLLPPQEQQTGKVLATNGVSASWVDTSSNGYTGSAGQTGYVGSQGATGYTGSGGTVGYTGSIGYTGSNGIDSAAVVSDTAPGSNYNGQLWFDSNTGRLKMWYVDVDSSQWVDAAIGTSTPLTTPYDIIASTFGVNTNNETIFRLRSPRAFNLPANFTGSIAASGIAATASTVYSIKKNNTQVATITWAAAGTTGTFSSQSAIAVAVGDLISIVGPATADATLADIDISVLAAL